jgi:hypothetical protein
MSRTDRLAGFTHRVRLLFALALLLTPVLGLTVTPALAAPSCATNGATITCTYSYTGAAETWTVPAGVTEATFDIYGAQGGSGSAAGGKGAHVHAVLAMTPGETLDITVAGQGNRTAGGYGGGGNGGDGYSLNDGFGGGGASSIGRAGALLLVAGGGGGSTAGNSFVAVGGGDSGSAGFSGSSFVVYGQGGNAGSPDGTGAGGAAGSGAAFACATSYDGTPGGDGQAGRGGNGGNGVDLGSHGSAGGGGGGGGYGGGGGGGSGAYCDTRIVAGGPGSGGGGSSYIDASATEGSTTEGVQSGNGLITITYLQPDNSPPVITPSIFGTQGNDGWYISDVTMSWSVTDVESGISAQSGCDSVSITSDTAGENLTCMATSVGGTDSKTVTIKRDATAPAVSVSGVTNGANYSLGFVPAASCSTTDALSGVATEATLSVTGGNLDGTGSFTASCSGASDKAGNTATATASYTVVNDPPSIAVVPGGACLSDTSASGTINLAVSDINTGASGLKLSLVSNSNPALVPTSGIKFGGSGASRTLTVTAANKKNGTATLTIGVSDGANTTTVVVTVMVGSDKNDTLSGTNGADMIFSLAGANTLSGQGGNDLLCGGNGNDSISGGDDADTLDGGRGDDVLVGGADNDILRGGAGNDRLTGGAGTDSFDGGMGADRATDRAATETATSVELFGP